MNLQVNSCCNTQFSNLTFFIAYDMMTQVGTILHLDTITYTLFFLTSRLTAQLDERFFCNNLKSLHLFEITSSINRVY